MKIKPSEVIERIEALAPELEASYSEVGFLSGIIGYLSTAYNVSDYEWQRALVSGRAGAEMCKLHDEARDKMPKVGA